MRYRAWAVLGLLLLGLPGLTAEAAPQDRVPPRVRQRVHTEGTVRVLVRLHLPGGGFTAESHLPAASVARQRQDVANVQSQIAARLRGKRHAVLRQYQTLPLLALEVGPDALAELEAAFSVDVIAEDRLRRPQLSDSVPQIEADLVWGNGFDGTGTVVAVLDTGVERSHAFLAGKVVEEACYSSNIAGQSQSVCSNGQESQTGPDSAAPCDIDGCYHGTHVAGVIAGSGAAAGVSFSGVARGAELMAVQVFSRITSPSLCGGFFFVPCLGAWESDIIAGLERVYQLRATRNFVAANLSLGGELFTAPCATDIHKPIIDNLRAAGIATIAASGNDGSLDSIAAPACVPTAISVGSVGPTDDVSWFSNVAPFLTLFAPGESVTSALQGGGFLAADGTSAATPHVAGAWAVLKQAAPTATVDEILDALVSTGLPVTEFLTGVTKPRIRVFQALASLVSSPLIGAISPPRGGQGQTLDVTIAGVNFQDGATASFGAGVDVTEVAVNSATEIVATVSIAMSATPGLRTVVVTNPDASSGTRVDGFRVTLPPPQVALAWNGKARDRVRPSETPLSADGQLDGTLTATVTGPGGTRTVTQLVLTAGGGEWDTIPDNLKWALGVANTLDSPLRNAADGSVNFAVVNETFTVFAADYENAHFPGGQQLTLAVTLDDGTVVAASTMVPFPPPPPPPPSMTLAWNGKVRDRARQSEGAAVGDGQLDGTLTMTVAGGPHTVKRLVLTTSAGGQWDTIPSNAKWTLGAADTLDAPAENAADGSVDFAVVNGAFSVFATDYENAHFPVGQQLTLTVTFDNDAVGSASVTIPPPPPAPAMTLAWNGKARDRARQSEGAAGSDGQLDGTLTATLTGAGGPWTVKRLVLTTGGGGQWDTIPSNAKWTLGAADTLDAPVRNAADGSVNFATVNGALSVFAADYENAHFPVGQQLTLTATFEGDTVAVASVTIPVPPPVVTAVSPATGAQGATVPVTVTGASFVSGATLSVGEGVTVSGVAVPSATQLTATLTIATNAGVGPRDVVVTNPGGASGTRLGGFQVTAPPPPPPPPPPAPAMTLAWNGKARDRVRQSEGAAIGDGQFDGTLTATLTGAGGPWMVKRLVLTTGGGGQWDTIPSNAKWTLGAADTLDAPVRNAADGSVNFATVNGALSVFAADYENAHFPVGQQLTLTATFEGDTVAVASVTIPVPPPVVTAVSPATGAQGATVPVTVTGASFVSGATLSVGEGVTVSGVAVPSATQLTATLAIATNAGVGPRDVVVTNPGGASGTRLGGFQVTAAPPPPPPPPPAPAMTLAWNGKARDRVRQSEGAAIGDGQFDGTLTATLTGAGGPWTVKRLVLTTSGGGQWDTIPSNGMWTLGAADTLDAPVRNAADGSVNFATVNGAFSVFATDYVNSLFPVGQQLTLTATFEGDAVAVASVTIPPPPPPPAMTLAWNGKVRDRARQSESAAIGDGQLDGTLTATVAGGPRTVKRLVLTFPGGGQWDTIPSNGKWTLGAADTLDTAVRNAADGSVLFGVVNGAFSVFATDYVNSLFPAGRQLTLTVTFDDDAVAVASVTIP